MGCGNSSQVQDVNSPIRMDGKDDFNSLIGKQSNKNTQCYLFGQTSGQRKVVYYNYTKQYFTTLSSRIRIPNVKVKLQPIEMLYEQSQQVILPELLKKGPSPPFNYMFGAFCRQNTIFLCGGISYELEQVYQLAYFYHINPEHTLKPKTLISDKIIPSNQSRTNIKFEELEMMKIKRYCHTGIYYQERQTKNQYIFIFGGRDGKHQITQACQRFDLSSRKWSNISPMNQPRGQASTIRYQQNIYVFGGITNSRIYIQNIEVYNPRSDSWSLLKINLHRGIRSCLVFSPNHNQILILGGISSNYFEQQKLTSVIKVNLLQQTYVWEVDLPQKISNIKYLFNQPIDLGKQKKDNSFNKQLIIFSNDNNIIYSYCIKDAQAPSQKNSLETQGHKKQWRTLRHGYKSFIPLGELPGFTCVVDNKQQVKYRPLLPKSKESEINKNHPLSKFFILGNQNYPCIFRLQGDSQGNILKPYPVSMKVHLKSNMIVHPLQQRIFIGGGLDHGGYNSYRQAFFLHKQSTDQTLNMEIKSIHEPRTKAGVAVTKNYIYLFGGIKVYKHIKTGLKDWERLNLNDGAWSTSKKEGKLAREIKFLKTKALKDQRRILLYGGKQVEGEENTLFQIYSQQHDQIISVGEFPQLKLENPCQIFVQEIKEDEIEALNLSQMENIYDISQCYSINDNASGFRQKDELKILNAWHEEQSKKQQNIKQVDLHSNTDQQQSQNKQIHKIIEINTELIPIKSKEYKEDKNTQRPNRKIIEIINQGAIQEQNVKKGSKSEDGQEEHEQNVQVLIPKNGGSELYIQSEKQKQDMREYNIKQEQQYFEQGSFEDLLQKKDKDKIEDEQLENQKEGDKQQKENKQSKNFSLYYIFRVYLFSFESQLKNSKAVNKISCYYLLIHKQSSKIQLLSNYQCCMLEQDIPYQFAFTIQHNGTNLYTYFDNHFQQSAEINNQNHESQDDTQKRQRQNQKQKRKGHKKMRKIELHLTTIQLKDCKRDSIIIKKNKIEVDKISSLKAFKHFNFSTAY